MGLTFMVPASHSGKKLKKITENGKLADYNSRSIKGREYALVTVHGGERYRIRADYR